ncbi:GNAT family N-acetyltransferase [Microbacterium azadirachtae]|uniref:Acetyltransferase (GNAT) family protein n=1 Tax=Microbacterium azadirachtae TaxID=582680 RepID=A0A0F0KF40_9MICO|nr:GNAT family N-acetyltransferase [Microbacterium azadirachtae]KJL19532.1 Acetyltransferase (GNAT) family protein [Microbacterium azadirachtae]SDL40674.1 Ribosomal protein S18 acetylase RimI [Microbacterium azadirachtae]SEF71430.1 Ribosomal protein S18 acetylase RimI [Microbacterium azadirachtae]SEF72093.1 Ribosomal protein S18 acetylase RimI [Microbacterium azadirachtae]
MTTITALTEADRDDWLSLWQAYLTFYESEVADDVTASTFARIVDPAGEIQGAVARDDDGRAVGIVHWFSHPATWSKMHYTYLEDLFVDPSARGGGVGRGLIAHVTDAARASGSDKVYWLTAETNATARTLYDRVAERSGFIHYQIDLV